MRYGRPSLRETLDAGGRVPGPEPLRCDRTAAMLRALRLTPSSRPLFKPGDRDPQSPPGLDRDILFQMRAVMRRRRR